MAQSKKDLRTFIAVTLTADIKSHFDMFQRDLDEFTLPIRWVKPDGIHLTLKFIGPTRESDCAQIARIIDKYARRFNPFEMSFGSAGVFPGVKRPRVLWIGLDKGAREMSEIQELLDKTLFHEIGLAREKRAFRPHITLGRIKAPCVIDEALRKLNSLIEDRILTMTVTSLTHYQSILKPTGAEYQVIHAASMNLTNV